MISSTSALNPGTNHSWSPVKWGQLVVFITFLALCLEIIYLVSTRDPVGPEDGIETLNAAPMEVMRSDLERVASRVYQLEESGLDPVLVNARLAKLETDLDQLVARIGKPESGEEVKGRPVPIDFVDPEPIPSPATTEEWTPMFVEARLGEVGVGVTRVELDRADASPFPDVDYLAIWIKVHNKSLSDSIPFRSPNIVSSDNRNILRDDKGKRYGNVLQGVMFYSPSRWVRPGLYMDERLVYEMPDLDSQELRLELDGHWFGQSGRIRFKIPMSEVKDLRK